MVKASGFLVLLKILLKDPALANEDTRKLLFGEKFRILNEKKIEKGYPDTFSRTLSEYFRNDYFICKNGGKLN